VGWTEAFGDEWTVYGSGYQRNGSFAILCGFVDGQSGTYRLQQTFDLTESADVIDTQQGLQIEYEGYARTYGFDDDIYRFRLRTLDGSGNEVDVDVTNNDTGTNYSCISSDWSPSPACARSKFRSSASSTPAARATPCSTICP
jgi:hypothetical protein